MSRSIEGQQRSQSVLFPAQLEDWICEDNPVGAAEALVEELEQEAQRNVELMWVTGRLAPDLTPQIVRARMQQFRRALRAA